MQIAENAIILWSADAILLQQQRLCKIRKKCYIKEIAMQTKASFFDECTFEISKPNMTFSMNLFGLFIVCKLSKKYEE